MHTYSWDADGNSITVDSVGATYDALDRIVELNRSGSLWCTILFHTTDILPCDRDEKLCSRPNSRTFRSRISDPQPNPQEVC